MYFGPYPKLWLLLIFLPYLARMRTKRDLFISIDSFRRDKSSLSSADASPYVMPGSWISRADAKVART